MNQNADIGLIGLGVMGQNLVLNMNDHGFIVAVHNRTASKVDLFLRESARDTSIIGCHSLPDFIKVLKIPRRIMIMVKAGRAVELLINQLVTLLDAGDIIIDGGNANFKDSIRQAAHLESRKILYIGCGVSGGEDGARHGPSMMPGGSKAAWPAVKGLFQEIAAKAPDGTPCCDWVGESGAGHFVKMVHNGIEYGDMQLISEAYDLLRTGLGLTQAEAASVFKRWNQGNLNSYLIEITGKILDHHDTDGTPMVDNILDTAGQKGTGMWTSIGALESGVPLTLISEAVFARYISALKDERVTAAGILSGPSPRYNGERELFIDNIENALFASKIISYTQGYMLFKAASKAYNWNLNYGGISLMWRGGCIIRAAFLDKIKEAFVRNPDLTNLLLDPYFSEQIRSAQAPWRRVISTGVELGIPLPAMTSALSFYDGYRRKDLPANLLQAQRDFFGAHTYERVDKPRGEFFHTDWS